MFTLREMKMMKKGFYPSRCGQFQTASSDEVICATPTERNRAVRRGNFKGNHRDKGGITKIIGNTRYVSRVQLIAELVRINGIKTVRQKRVLHWDLK